MEHVANLRRWWVRSLRTHARLTTRARSLHAVVRLLLTGQLSAREAEAIRGTPTERRDMKNYWGFVAIAALTACGSQNNPPPASAASVEQATSTPATGPSFTPATTDGTASATPDAQASAKPGSGSFGPGNPPPSSATAATDNAAATPVEPSSKPTLAPDNSGVNARDRNGQTLTPTDQGSSEADRKLTQHVRQALVKDNSLSFTAKNIKVITVNGKVTLRGPVKSDAEKASVEATAKKIAGDGQVESYLEVKN